MLKLDKLRVGILNAIVYLSLFFTVHNLYLFYFCYIYHLVALPMACALHEIISTVRKRNLSAQLCVIIIKGEEDGQIKLLAKVFYFFNKFIFLTYFSVFTKTHTHTIYTMTQITTQSHKNSNNDKALKWI